MGLQPFIGILGLIGSLIDEIYSLGLIRLIFFPPKIDGLHRENHTLKLAVPLW